MLGQKAGARAAALHFSAQLGVTALSRRDLLHFAKKIVIFEIAKE